MRRKTFVNGSQEQHVETMLPEAAFCCSNSGLAKGSLRAGRKRVARKRSPWILP